MFHFFHGVYNISVLDVYMGEFDDHKEVVQHVVFLRKWPGSLRHGPSQVNCLV